MCTRGEQIHCMVHMEGMNSTWFLPFTKSAVDTIVPPLKLSDRSNPAKKTRGISTNGESKSENHPQVSSTCLCSSACLGDFGWKNREGVKGLILCCRV
jgi:hypothetical protein